MSESVDEMARKRLERVQLDDLNVRTQAMLDNQRAFNSFMGPMRRMFKREQQYQTKIVPAGGSDTVYILLNPQPEILVGIITQVGNGWTEGTYLEWFTDYEPKRVDYVIGAVHEPKHYERGIPFHEEVKWIGYNNTNSDYAFEVLCDGFFMDRKIYDLIVW